MMKMMIMKTIKARLTKWERGHFEDLVIDSIVERKLERDGRRRQEAKEPVENENKQAKEVRRLTIIGGHAKAVQSLVGGHRCGNS